MQPLNEAPWHLDLFSTILSRKHSYHKLIGKKRYVRVKKQVVAQQPQPKKTRITFLGVTV